MVSDLVVLVYLARTAWSGTALGTLGIPCVSEVNPGAFVLFPTGIPSGFTHQVCTIPWAVQQLPHQAVLHLQHSHHPAVCLSVKPLCHFPDVVCSFQWQLLGEFTGAVGSKYSVTFYLIELFAFVLWCESLVFNQLEYLLFNICKEKLFQTSKRNSSINTRWECGKSVKNNLLPFSSPLRMSVEVALLAPTLLVACATTCPLQNPWVQYLRILSM